VKRTNSTTPGGLDLDTIRARAASATAAAGALRDRVASGDPIVNFAALASVEADERLTDLQLDAAEQRAAQQRERDEAAQLEADRAAMQQEWAAAHAPDADAEVRTRMAAAVAAAITYIRAAQDRANYLEALAVRAQTLRFPRGRSAAAEPAASARSGDPRRGHRRAALGADHRQPRRARQQRMDDLTEGATCPPSEPAVDHAIRSPTRPAPQTPTISTSASCLHLPRRRNRIRAPEPPSLR